MFSLSNVVVLSCLHMQISFKGALTFGGKNLYNLPVLHLIVLFRCNA